MVTAALRSVFAQEYGSEIESRWEDRPPRLPSFPKATELMLEPKEDVLVCRHFPQPHWRRIWSTNLLERLNEEVKRRTWVVGIFPNYAAITRLVGAVLLKHDVHWQLEGLRMISVENMVAIQALDALQSQASLQEAGV
jgi:putative transposase